MTSALHDRQALDAASSEFLAEIGTQLEQCGGEYAPKGGSSYELVLKGEDFSDYGAHDLEVVYVRTGGTEGQFAQVYRSFIRPAGPSRPVRLLTSGKSNSLAASMEILSFLRQNGIRGEILHGDSRYIAERLSLLARVDAARKKLSAMRLGVIGKPSDWLISSAVDYDLVREKWGLELVDIPISELVAQIDRKTYPMNDALAAIIKDTDRLPAKVKEYWEGALFIYGGLKRIVEKYRLDGLTIRCFDLLSAVRNTGCLALALLNAEGIPGGCEGDIPTLLTMALSQALVGVSGFQANPSRIDPRTGEVLFAHCTVPFNMLKSHTYDTHFESGIGVALHGELPTGEVTVFKVSPDLSRHCVGEATLVANQYKPDLCRTQIVLKTQGLADYFLKDPIGNHHVILPGRCASLIEAFFD